MFQQPDSQLNTNTPAATAINEEGERHKTPLPLFLPFLAISIFLHLLLTFLLLQPQSTVRNAPGIQYVDLRNITLPEPAAAPPASQAPPDVQSKPHEDVAGQQTTAKSDTPPQPRQANETPATSLGMGLAKGYFRSLAEGKSLRDDIRNYYFEMVERINAGWWQRADSLKEAARQEGIIDIVLGRDGTLYSVSIASGTGSSEVDQAIIDVVRAASPFSPLPASYQGEQFRAPLRIVAPAALFRFSK